MAIRLIRAPIWAAAVPALALALSACEEAPESPDMQTPIAVDPLVARALNDPLMIDPDLAYRNEANAAVTIRNDQPLPVFSASDGAAARARDAARLELLKTGEISDLPDPKSDAPHGSLRDAATAAAIIAQIGGPEQCAAVMTDGLSWAASMPDGGRVMPHGMVQAAAGSDAPGCNLRIVRYLTPAPKRDVLQYHFNRAMHFRMAAQLFDGAETILTAQSRKGRMVVHVRAAANGLSAVDLIYWTV